MTNVIIRRDRARATASIYLDGYPATPTWNSRYKGPVWKPGEFTGAFANIQPTYPSAFFPEGSFGTFSRARIVQMGNAMIELESTYDTMDSGGGTPLPGVSLKAYSHVDLDLIFKVTDGNAAIEFSGPGVVPTPEHHVKFTLYNLTDGNLLTNSTQGNFTLLCDHVYRLRAHTHAEGSGDLTAATPSLILIRFVDATVKVPGAPESDL